MRYWLWFSASLKFLIPFSLLLTLGGYLGRSPAAKSIAVPAITYTVVQVAEPFPRGAFADAGTTNHGDWIPIALVGLWVCGIRGHSADAASRLAPHSGGGARQHPDGYSISRSGPLFSRPSGAWRGGVLPPCVAAAPRVSWSA